MFTSRVFTNEKFDPNPSFPNLLRWPDHLHPQFTRNTKNLTIAIQTLALWKSISSNSELASVIEKCPNYALLITAGPSGDPYFLHNLTYDPIDQTFTGFPGTSLLSVPIKFRIPDHSFGTLNIALSLVQDMVNIRNTDYIPVTVNPMSPDHPGLHPGAVISRTPVTVRFPDRDPTSVIGEIPIIQEPDVPDLTTFIGSLVLDLELGTPGNNEYISEQEVAILPKAVPGDPWVYLPGFVLIPPFLVNDMLLAVDLAFYKGTAFCCIDNMMAALLLRSEKVAKELGNSAPAQRRVKKFNVFIHWIISWLSTTKLFGFIPIEQIYMNASEAISVLLAKVPVGVQDPISDLLLRIDRANGARMEIEFDSHQRFFGGSTPIQSTAPANDHPSPEESIDLNDLFGLESGVSLPAANIFVSAPDSSTIRTNLPPLPAQFPLVPSNPVPSLATVVPTQNSSSIPPNRTSSRIAAKSNSAASSPATSRRPSIDAVLPTGNVATPIQIDFDSAVSDNENLSKKGTKSSAESVSTNAINASAAYSTAASNLTPRQTNVSTNIIPASELPASLPEIQVTDLTDSPRTSRRHHRHHKSKRGRRSRRSSRYSSSSSSSQSSTSEESIDYDAQGKEKPKRRHPKLLQLQPLSLLPSQIKRRLRYYHQHLFLSKFPGKWMNR